MSSWTLNTVLAAMAASAVFLPSPGEVRKAIQYQHDQSSMEIRRVDHPQKAIQIEGTNQLENVRVLIDFPASVDCLEQTGMDEARDLNFCIPVIVSLVEQFDRNASSQVAAGLAVTPNMEIEAARLSVVNLCRARWSMETGTSETPSMDDCRTVSTGLDY